MSLTVSHSTLARSMAVLAICGALAACGGAESSSGSPASTGSSSSEGGDQDAGRVRLTQCLRENGVDVPDNAGPGGGGGAPDIDRDKLQEAMNGPCKQYQTDAVGNISDEDRQEMQDSFQEFAQCMRENGVEIPDITSGGGPPAGGGIDQDDPDVQAATKTCQSKLPQGGPGGGGQ